MGKTTILNSLVGSLFVYKMNVLPAINEEETRKTERVINNFLWGKDKRAKIALKKLYNTKEYGGLKLVDIKNKDNALKVQWVSHYKESPKVQALAKEFIPRNYTEFWECNVNKRDVSCIVKPGFWRDVALAWSKLNFYEPTNHKQVLNQHVWYNSHLRINKKIFCYRKALEAGVCKISDFCNDSVTEICMFQQFQERFPDALTWLQFGGIVDAIPVKWKNELKTNYTDKDHMSRYLALKPKSTKNVYTQFVEDRGMLKPLREEWETKLGISIEEDDFEELFSELYKTTPNSKLRSFQFRLLHQKIFLNKILYVWKLAESSLCSYCQEDYETIEHLFVNCRITKRFWELLQSWYECLTDTEIMLTPSIILFNNMDNWTINAILLSAKQFIFSRKVQDKFINFYVFKDILREQIKIELNRAKQIHTTKGWKNFNKKWGKVIRI